MSSESHNLDNQGLPEVVQPADGRLPEVPKELLARAGACRKNHGCCTGSNGECPELCRVTSRLGKDLLFVESKGVHFCPYRQAFGFSHLCTCPVRYHLHEKHGR